MTSKLKCSCSKCTFSTQQSASSGLPDKGYISYRGLIAKTSCKSLSTFAAFWFVSSILCPRALNRHCIISPKAMKHIPDCLSQLTNKIWIVWIKPRYHCSCSFLTFFFLSKTTHSHSYGRSELTRCIDTLLDSLQLASLLFQHRSVWDVATVAKAARGLQREFPLWKCYKHPTNSSFKRQ